MDGKKNSSILHVVAFKLEKFVNVCVCIFLVTIALAVIIQVFGRRFNIPVVWLGELSTFCLVWVVFFGLAIGYRHGLFAQVDMICLVLPKSWKKYLQLLWDFSGIVIMSIILWSSKDYISHVYKTKTLSSELEIPLFIVYLGPVLGYLFTCIFTLVNIADGITLIKNGGSKEKGGEKPC